MRLCVEFLAILSLVNNTPRNSTQRRKDAKTQRGLLVRFMLNRSSISGQFVFWSYAILVFTGLIVPSDGQHGFLSIKSMAYLLACGSFALYFFSEGKLRIKQIKILLFFLCALLFLLTWLWIGIWHENSLGPSQIDQLKLFVITLSFPLMTLCMIKENLLSIPQFLKIVLAANTCYISAKMILVVLHLLQWIDIWHILHTLGFRFMRMSIAGNIERVQTSSDVVTPFLVFFLLESKSFGLNLSKGFKAFYLILALASCLLSFSRYLIFIYCCSVLLYLMHQNLSRIIKSIAGISLFLVASYLVVGTDTVDDMVKRRLASAENYNSDLVRGQQMDSLLKEYEKASFFGKGLGGYASDYIRDPLLLHHYEVQWFAFLMQFGFIGILGILISLGLIAYRFFLPPFTLQKYSFFFLFLLWLISGFTNPFLISLASGIVYTLFYVSGLSLSPAGSPPRVRQSP